MSHQSSLIFMASPTKDGWIMLNQQNYGVLQWFHQPEWSIIYSNGDRLTEQTLTEIPLKSSVINDLPSLTFIHHGFSHSIPLNPNGTMEHPCDFPMISPWFLKSPGCTVCAVSRTTTSAAPKASLGAPRSAAPLLEAALEIDAANASVSSQRRAGDDHSL